MRDYLSIDHEETAQELLQQIEIVLLFSSRQESCG